VKRASGHRGLSRGQTSEFVQLLTGTQSRLYTYICSLIGEAAGARDVLQETNLVLWEKAQDYDPSRPFLPWAYRFAYLQVRAHRQKCARSRLVFDDQLVSELAEEFLRRDENHDRRLEALEHCLEKLPGPRREILDRRYRDGETVDRIAQRMHKAPNVIAASLYRIRNTLHECIESKLTAP
jgi:RNA polymerase sigma-70 factor (ECF subfamily)